MFGRSKSQDVPPATPDLTESGRKGRPTPTRREAEAAAKARAKVPRTRREQLAAQRATRSQSGKSVRQAMKDGDERFMMPRDKGPVRRFIRDFVDSRFSIVELMVPLLIVTLLLGYSGSAQLVGIGNTVLFATLLMVVLDLVMMRFRLRRELARRFPEEPTKGTTYYAIMRALQMKFMRMPKAKVKIGQTLPEHYR